MYDIRVARYGYPMVYQTVALGRVTDSTQVHFYDPCMQHKSKALEFAWTSRHLFAYRGPCLACFENFSDVSSPVLIYSGNIAITKYNDNAHFIFYKGQKGHQHGHPQRTSRIWGLAS